ncbi:MAG: DUF3667 domain-containing protein [Lysobacteraceae bacterium]
MTTPAAQPPEGIDTVPAGDDACANCNAVLVGEYCAACGQRRFRDSDRRLGHLLGEAFEQLTDLDGRFLRSLRGLMLRPGRIARDWFDGRKARWMSPLTLFLFANVLFFFAPGLTDLTLGLSMQVPEPVLREFRTPAQNEANRVLGGQFHSPVTAPLAQRALARAREAADAAGRQFDLDRFAIEYHARSDAIGKALVIVHVPLVALALMLTAWRSRRYFAEHMLLALTLVAFTLLFIQLVLMPTAWVYLWAMNHLGPGGTQSMPTFARLGLVGINVGYFAFACRRCYDSGWLLAVVQGLLAFVALAFGNLVVYRGLQLLITLWTM